MKLRITSFIALSLASTMALAASGSSVQDANSDGNISKDEFFGSMSDVGVYSDWDSDNDGLLTEDEFNELDWDYDFATWDADSNTYLDAGEFYDGYYNSYDEDENGHWDENEWDDAGDGGLFDV